MFARVFALLPLALLVSAANLKARYSWGGPSGGSWGGSSGGSSGGSWGGDQCSTGKIQCCNSLQSVDEAHDWLSKQNLVDAALAAVGLVGFDCSPIDVLAVGGNSCTEQTACCNNDNFNGLVNLGCNPININL